MKKNQNTSHVSNSYCYLCFCPSKGYLKRALEIVGLSIANPKLSQYIGIGLLDFKVSSFFVDLVLVTEEDTFYDYEIRIYPVVPNPVGVVESFTGSISLEEAKKLQALYMEYVIRFPPEGF